MSRIGLFILLSLLTFTGSFADAIQSFEWSPERYEGSFNYDVFYYVPPSLSGKANSKSLIFLHGGGKSTQTKAGSIAVAKNYIRSMKKLADDLEFVLIVPSANGLNWGAHTRGMVRDLARKMRKSFHLDPNRMGLSGHSMGGMGITRNFHWLADEFAFFLPVAAGMAEVHQIEHNLNKTFNTPYVHLQGLQDQFKTFVTLSNKQAKKIEELETQYGVNSLFKLNFYDGGHNTDMPLYGQTLKTLFERPRNLYQKELWGSLHPLKAKYTFENINFDFDSEVRYFWVEALETDPSVDDRVDFHAKITANRIDIELPSGQLVAKALRLYLHSSLVDLSQTVEVYLNGSLVRSHNSSSKIRISDPHGPAFLFDDIVDIRLEN